MLEILVKETEDGREKYAYGCVYSKDDQPAEQLLSDAVVLATGGYAYDRGENSLLREFCPSLCHLPTSSGEYADSFHLYSCESTVVLRRPSSGRRWN